MKSTNLILLAALLCAPVITRAVTVITSLPYTISTPGSYVVENNLTVNGGIGISVNASNVSIDLGGDTLSQTHAYAELGDGIYVLSGVSNVCIQNGSITGFNEGILIRSPGNTVRNVRLLSNVVGIEAVYANDCLIESCLIIASPGGSSVGIELEFSAAVRVKDNQMSGFTYGLWEYATKLNALLGNYEANCTYGLYLDSGNKYELNVTTNCSTPVVGGVAVGQENG